MPQHIPEELLEDDMIIEAYYKAKIRANMRCRIVGKVRKGPLDSRWCKGEAEER